MQGLFDPVVRQVLNLVEQQVIETKENQNAVIDVFAPIYLLYTREVNLQTANCSCGRVWRVTIPQQSLERMVFPTWRDYLDVSRASVSLDARQIF